MRRIFVSVMLIFMSPHIPLGQADPNLNHTDSRVIQVTRGGRSGVIILQNYYYAKPGKEAEVLTLRLHASEVLKKLGVRSGRVLRREKNRFDVTSTDDPDVIWECEFPDEESLRHDVQIVRASPEFDAVQKQMGTLLRNFESRRWKLQVSPVQPE